MNRKYSLVTAGFCLSVLGGVLFGVSVVVAAPHDPSVRAWLSTFAGMFFLALGIIAYAEAYGCFFNASKDPTTLLKGAWKTVCILGIILIAVTALYTGVITAIYYHPRRVGLEVHWADNMAYYTLYLLWPIAPLLITLALRFGRKIEIARCTVYGVSALMIFPSIVLLVYLLVSWGLLPIIY